MNSGKELMNVQNPNDYWNNLLKRGHPELEVVSIHCDNTNIYYLLVERPPITQVDTSQRQYTIIWMKYDALRLEVQDSLDFIRLEPSLKTDSYAKALPSHVVWGSHQAYPFLCVLSPSLHYVLYFFNLKKKKIEFTGEDKQLAVLGRKIGPHTLGGLASISASPPTLP